MKTTQEVFDIVVTHLLVTQRQPAREGEAGRGRCRYKNQMGLTCAVGCLINEDQYNDDLEEAGSLVTCSRKQLISDPTLSVKQRSAILLINILSTNGIDTNDEGMWSLLISLQNIHDHSTYGSWYEKLKQLAENHHLVFNYTQV